MEKRLKSLKSKTIISLILGLLAITWQFLNYLTIKDHLPLDNFASLGAIIVYSSYLFIAIFFISFLFLAFSVLRISMTYKSEMKKLAKEKEQQKKKLEQKPSTDKKEFN
ncbi:MAG: hypothetical protein CR986_10325 [Ignavibacteriae bacterium]|nr:MAG: hypothetical protein CR986_10325 [Ignavibacteriota bacterium]